MAPESQNHHEENALSFLASNFSSYEESERGRIDAHGRQLRRIVHR
jgi:hypothetical protein